MQAHKTNNSVPVRGISINTFGRELFRNKLPDGSKTSVNFQALTDGYDTVSYIQKGYADFIMLIADGSINDTKLLRLIKLLHGGQNT